MGSSATGSDESVMKSAIVALFLAGMPTTVFAQETTSSIAESFRGVAATIPADPSIAGQWVILLPTIAKRCQLAVDQERVATFVGRLADPEAIDEAADFYAAHPDSRLRASWDVIADRDQAGACRLARTLWGLHGALADGVLRGSTESTRRQISQHSPDAETR